MEIYFCVFIIVKVKHDYITFFHGCFHMIKNCCSANLSIFELFLPLEQWTSQTENEMFVSHITKFWKWSVYNTVLRWKLFKEKNIQPIFWQLMNENDYY